MSNIALVRYNVDGSLDTSFGTSLNGIITGSVGDSSGIRALAIDANNKIARVLRNFFINTSHFLYIIYYTKKRLVKAIVAHIPCILDKKPTLCYA